jgi:GTPase
VLLARKPDSLNDHVVWEFDVDVHVLYHESMFGNLSQGLVYLGSATQAAKIIRVFSHRSNEDVFSFEKSVEWIDFPGLKTGEVGRLRLKLMIEPEYLHVGMRILFREGKNKCIGKVVHLC